jgi:hypothetical protein
MRLCIVVHKIPGPISLKLKLKAMIKTLVISLQNLTSVFRHKLMTNDTSSNNNNNNKKKKNNQQHVNIVSPSIFAFSLSEILVSFFSVKLCSGILFVDRTLQTNFNSTLVIDLTNYVELSTTQETTSCAAIR